jgi:hypothetical protein
MFEEAQNQLSRQFRSSATLRDHAKTIIGVSSVVVSFFATFRVFDNALVNYDCRIISMFLFIAFAYGALMILAIKAANPIALEGPINPTLKNFEKAYADKDEKTILSNQITLYLRAIEKNNKIIRNQHKLLTAVNYLLALTVILIVIATVFFVLP